VKTGKEELGFPRKKKERWEEFSNEKRNPRGIKPPASITRKRGEPANNLDSPSEGDEGGQGHHSATAP